MKLKCLKDKTDPSSGILGLGAHNGKKINGLTKDRIYSGVVINMLGGGGNRCLHNDLRFLIFNDNEQWQTYNLSLFEPSEK